jgi:hypothetical protein
MSARRHWARCDVQTSNVGSPVSSLFDTMQTLFCGLGRFTIDSGGRHSSLKWSATSQTRRRWASRATVDAVWRGVAAF